MQEVADTVHPLPAHEQRDVVLLAQSYGEAGAFDRYRERYDLRVAYSPHNSYADFRQRTNRHATVVAVRYDPGDLARYFSQCDEVARVDNYLGVDNEA